MRPVLFLLLFFTVPASAQNFLVNGGFEEENICSEFKINCAPEGWIYTVPSFIYYFKDGKAAHSWAHYVALIAGHSKKRNYRTFVRSRLLCGLRKGNIYRLEFFIRSVHPVLDSVGVYFTSYDFLFENRAYRKIIPSVYLADAVKRPVKNDTGWQQVVINYQANGEEAFIALGNFSKADITGPTRIDRENNFFVLLDDISLTPENKLEKLCPDWLTAQEEIYSQDERHEYLSRLIKEGKSNPLQTVKLTPGILQKVDTLILPDLLFVTNSFYLNKRATNLLNDFVASVPKNNIDSFVVEGHTDNTGTPSFNRDLSLNRAHAVAGYLQKFTKTKIISRGLSSSKPVADNETKEGRQQNRRVEIYLYLKE
jgi:outer membrane protein OmpA-like peptidoglycan-associated protein